ncbi:TPA: hypothetical protein DCZ39_07480 [Patescibacteria group bacterium]|nr:hypothetical protein [Candidatus Gracilibacteria bacterium]
MFSKRKLFKNLFYMQSEFLLKWPLFIVSIAGILFSSIIIFFLTFFYIPVQGSSYSSSFITSGTYITTGKQMTPGVPIRIKISKLKIDAPIKSLGITSQ